ncbi:MAG TPA: M56 family metallopeptidase, partial [Chryseosolibacter sp.]|nr:M56 family metallopeptidase [Chryseosolibacter sp.]
MNMIPDLFRSDWATALGWTLLHSVWQSLVLLVIVFGCLRFIPASHSRARYAVSCAALLFIVVASVITFIHIVGQADTAGVTINHLHPQYAVTAQNDAGAPGMAKLIGEATAAIQRNIPLIITAWAAGLLFFIGRLLSGIAYTYRLTSTSLSIENNWAEYIHKTAAALGINRIISLAQSHAINSPMVIGYFKPVILIPIGMLSGLTTEQLETIFLHELAHIKRHDYLINLVQSVVETIFFFNPAIWALSELIRKEREFCCDDAVIGTHGHATAYAHALVHLEEVRLSRHAFALSLAENKNQLLNRIKRIMERSVKNHAGRGRLVLPALLLAAGLTCISWLSIQEEKTAQDTSKLVGDTIKPKNQKGTAWYSRKKIITMGKDGRPHEDITENFQGDESLRPLMKQGMPDFSQIMPPGFSMSPGFQALSDSLPLADSVDRQKWEEFSKSFQDRFGKGFEQFYSFHGMDPSTFMKEFDENFNLPDMFGDLDNFSFPADSLSNFPGFDND